MHHRRNRLVRTLGVVVLVGLIAAACGSDDKKGATDTTTKKSDFVAMSGVPGVTDTEIHFSALGTSTAKNPLGECLLECFADGIEAYFAYRNAEGGIFGRDLVLDDPLDDELGKGQQLALEITSKNDTLATFLVPLISPAYAVFADANWPAYGYLTDHTAMANKTSLFSTYSVSAFDVPKVDHVYVAKAVKATKLGAIGYNVGSSQTCVDQIVDEFKGEYADTGIKVVYSNRDLAFGLANCVAPEVTAMKSAGVELVFTCV